MEIVIAVAVGLVVARTAVRAHAERDRFWGAVAAVALCAPVTLTATAPTAVAAYVATVLGATAVLLLLPERGAGRAVRADDARAVRP
ncbi:hypothetical protein CLV28_1057 [Sediminihabitans luteus]|uniref:Uncharacterized protein n=1 Tax=Sediminihabitans luteus TaxID=1138585 RepID=A0A2M9D0V4_9CELL|nr:hypothetical protein [Sediminihabitans luteus]PJJ77831.1 hypothetical protein CLV28_1057 [Sediminihabitans luteus]GII99811.1 hypothetical protein Slu03_21890 [Sediminihabitans luteus]